MFKRREEQSGAFSNSFLEGEANPFGADTGGPNFNLLRRVLGGIAALSLVAALAPPNLSHEMSVGLAINRHGILPADVHGHTVSNSNSVSTGITIYNHPVLIEPASGAGDTVNKSSVEGNFTVTN